MPPSYRSAHTPFYWWLKFTIIPMKVISTAPGNIMLFVMCLIHSISMCTCFSPLHEPLHHHIITIWCPVCNYQWTLSPHEYQRFGYHKPHEIGVICTNLPSRPSATKVALRARQQDGATGGPSQCCDGDWYFRWKRWKNNIQELGSWWYCVFSLEVQLDYFSLFNMAENAIGWDFI